LKNLSQKKYGGVAQDECSEFKSQYCKEREREREREIIVNNITQRKILKAPD
jgi:hypothetical protein